MNPKKRVHNFKEVELGFSKEQALKEAVRCLQCPEPSCVEGCAARIQIRDFIKALAEEKGEDAVRIIEETNYFPKICGRICQQEFQIWRGATAPIARIRVRSGGRGSVAAPGGEASRLLAPANLGPAG